MSLINEMLRDLEARRADGLGKPDLQREIRPLPESRQRSRWRRPLLFVVAAFALVLLAWWQGDGWLYGEPVRPAAVPSPATLPLSLVQPAQPVAVDPPPAAVSEALRLAMTLENPPAESALAAKALASESLRPELQPPGTESIPPRPELIPPRTDAATPKPKAVEAPAASSGSIEKTAVPATPRERADAEFRRAQGLLAGGQASAAHDALQAALKQDATYIAPRQALLRLLLEARRLDEAMAVLHEGLEVLPAQTGWAMSLARLTVERGDAAGAERVLARSAPYAVGNAEYAGFHGHLLNRLGKFRAAAEQYQAAARSAPGDGRWWFGLGLALEGEGHGQEAREAFRRALATGNLNADLAAMAEQKLR